MNTPEDARPLPPGTKVHEFIIQSTLGIGGFGIVYKATHSILEETLAIKEFLPRDLAFRSESNRVQSFPGKEETYQWARDKFLQEAKTLKELGVPIPHPNLVQVVHAFEENDTVYMCMRYEEGPSLEELLRQQGSVPEAQLKEILFPLLDGLAHAHAHRVWHRDIKPANIVIRRNGSPILIDFGAARRDYGNRDQSRLAQYTPGYAAPEQYWSGGEQGPWSDIYALGATLYRAITGSPPQALSREKLHLDYADSYSPTFLAAIEAALQPRPEDRPRSVIAWRACFERPDASRQDAAAPTVLSPEHPPKWIASTESERTASAGSGPQAHPPATAPKETTATAGPRHWPWAVALGLAACLIGGVVWWTFLKSSSWKDHPPTPPARPSETQVETEPSADTTESPTSPVVEQPGTPQAPKPEPEPKPERQETAGSALFQTLAAIAEYSSRLRCGSLTGEIAPSQVVTVKGYVEDADDLGGLHQYLRARRHEAPIDDSGVEVLGSPFCGIIAEMLEVSARSDPRYRGASIGFGKPTPVFREGDYLSFQIANGNQLGGYVYVDYIDADANVTHLLPTPTNPTHWIKGLSRIIIGGTDKEACERSQCYEVYPPHGKNLVLVTWSREPLLPHPRKAVTEPSTDYFPALASRVRAHQEAGKHGIAMSYRFLVTEP